MKDQALIHDLAALARLSFEGEAGDRMARDMESIMRLMDTVAEAEISETDLPPAEGGMELLREDEQKPSMAAGEILANAKGRQGSFFAVPKLIE
ncbi:MAG: Asp-tRNA(Asn)/Glu-tRNA(Gln) amidotransferase subunit GatC [Clostridia bacterium]|nr:Asp-tRNA(Asn)/Glu-tRNA(Gln) amidotransferase subunit GatC [Clostridia bacterium]